MFVDQIGHLARLSGAPLAAPSPAPATFAALAEHVEGAVQAALELAGIDARTGRKEPTVIT